MKAKKLSLVWLIQFICICSTAIGQSRGARLEAYFEALYQNDLFNGNVLVAQEGKVHFERSFGYADFGTGKRNTSSTKFPIASITKTFTATAILQLQETGKLRIVDSVKKYLPEFPYPTVTLKHLLSHTSGLRPYDHFFDSLQKSDPSRVFTNSDILPQLSASKLPLFYEPGEHGNYDNINFIVLALVVERISGLRFYDYLSKNILAPAGMTNTILPEFAAYHYALGEKKDLANLYWYPQTYSRTRVKSDTVEFISAYWHSYNFRGFGEIVTTLRDLLRYDQALSSGKLLNDASLEEAYAFVNLNNGEMNPGQFGLAWMIFQDRTLGKTVRASGGMIGLRATFLRNLSKKQTIVIVDNTQNETNGIAKDVLDIINGIDVPLRGKSLAKAFGRALVDKGKGAALLIREAYEKDPSAYSADENEINVLGYELMQNNLLSEALEVFQLNVKLFPHGWNVYDSYGECLLKVGNKNEAIKMYKRSLELNPKNENGKEVLARLGED